MGDFILPNINWTVFTCESTSNTNIQFKFFECIHDCFINQLVDYLTRIRIGQRPNILNLVLTNIDGHISNANVGSAIGRSDLGTIAFNINLLPITEEGKFKRYLYDNGDYKEMTKYLK